MKLKNNTPDIAETQDILLLKPKKAIRQNGDVALVASRNGTDDSVGGANRLYY
jgi:hypothetical protein